MKRNPVTYPVVMYRSFPIFAWLRCQCCKNDFRRETGWRYLSGPFWGGSGFWKYICGTCAPSREAASNAADKIMNIFPERPAPPNPPPKLHSVK